MSPLDESRCNSPSPVSEDYQVLWQIYKWQFTKPAAEMAETLVGTELGSMERERGPPCQLSAISGRQCPSRCHFTPAAAAAVSVSVRHYHIVRSHGCNNVQPLLGRSSPLCLKRSERFLMKLFDTCYTSGLLATFEKLKIYCCQSTLNTTSLEFDYSSKTSIFIVYQPESISF